MRSFIVAALVLFSAALLQGQKPQAQTNPGAACGDQSVGLPDFYYEAVLEHIQPPVGRGVISIMMGGEKKLVLWTDGEKFQLLMDTPDTAQEGINKFLLDLDQSCRLPADPADAAALIKVKWESKELSPVQFAQIHRDFTSALSQYVSKIQERYGSRALVEYLDAIRFSIVYDNNHEHIEVEAWDVPENGKTSPMIKWAHEFRKLAKDSFPGSFAD